MKVFLTTDSGVWVEIADISEVPEDQIWDRCLKPAFVQLKALMEESKEVSI